MSNIITFFLSPFHCHCLAPFLRRVLMRNHHREYEVIVRQEPKQACMCGVGP
ncbi:hypothetical protein BGW80DRAFT_1356781 [Lactifluus volemus]|nr:hypothetical protein BGW80DRAFT_1356781 [Lactifluus volemus]